MATLERALEIAADAYADQTDKAGEPYVLHPIRLMQQMDTTDERIVALLHDVLEDSDWELTDLRDEGFSARVVDAVDNLTKPADADYDAYVDNLAADSLAATVKQADLEDNLDLTRLDSLDEDATDRIEKYHRNWRRLQE
jgi:(p)ppGpp synthase/HD superfamily hydrolase